MRPGAFTFRFWINDTTPPPVKLRTPTVATGKRICVAVHDAGSGVDPHSIFVLLNGHFAAFSYTHGVLAISPPAGLTGRVPLVVHAADYQELKNMEDVGPVLPNTRVLRTFVTLS